MIHSKGKNKSHTRDVIAMGMKKMFDGDCDIVIDENIKNKSGFELVITRTGDNGEENYLVQLDEHEEGSDEYNQILEVGCDIDDFLVIIDAYVKHGGSINSLYEFADELNATKKAKPDSGEVFFYEKRYYVKYTNLDKEDDYCGDFWEISLSDRNLNIRSGKTERASEDIVSEEVPESVKTETLTFPTVDAAIKAADKLINEKVNQEYCYLFRKW